MPVFNLMRRVYIFVRTVYESKEVKTNLVTAKSRVAPLKKMSIPRLELVGNLILARLMYAVDYFKINSSELYWIKQNQTSIDGKKIKCLRKQLSITRVENELLRCVGDFLMLLYPMTPDIHV